MRRAILAAAVIAAAAITGLGVSPKGTLGAAPAAAPPQAPRPAAVVVRSEKEYASTVVQVAIRNYAFNPDRVVVRPGTTVVFTQYDFDAHNVHIFKDGKGNALRDDIVSDMLSRGQAFAVTFYEPGTYEFQCDPHPVMTGKVVVSR